MDNELLTLSVLNGRKDKAEACFPLVRGGFSMMVQIDDTAKCGYPSVELERKMFAFLVGSNREQDQPDPKCALMRAICEEKNKSSIFDRHMSLMSMLRMLVQGIEAQLEKPKSAFAKNREIYARQPDDELMMLVTEFVLPDPNEAVKKPGGPAATGKRGAVEAQPVVKEEPGNAATTSKRARHGK